MKKELTNEKSSQKVARFLEKNGLHKKDFAENSYQSLLLFLQTYFPSKKNIDTVEKYRSRFI